MPRHERFIERAVGIALTSDCRQRHGSIITKGPRLMSWSTNLRRNDPEVDHKAATYHAEDAAMRELSRKARVTYGYGDFRGYTLYVARVSAKGEPVLSRPCSKCMYLIAQQGITTVIYTNEVYGFSMEILG